MESAKIISYISLGVSSITVIFGFFVFLKYDRRLKNQEKRLNKKTEYYSNGRYPQRDVRNNLS